jgi:hypothetical protein
MHGPEPCDECGVTHTPSWYYYDERGELRSPADFSNDIEGIAHELGADAAPPPAGVTLDRGAPCGQCSPTRRSGLAQQCSSWCWKSARRHPRAGFEWVGSWC